MCIRDSRFLSRPKLRFVQVDAITQELVRRESAAEMTSRTDLDQIKALLSRDDAPRGMELVRKHKCGAVEGGTAPVTPRNGPKADRRDDGAFAPSLPIARHGPENPPSMSLIALSSERPSLFRFGPQLISFNREEQK